MTMNEYTVISGETYTVTAASADRALDVFHIEQGNMYGDLFPGETCEDGETDTFTMPYTAPVRDLLTALDNVGIVLGHWYAAHQDEEDEDALAALEVLFGAAAAIRGTVN